MTGPEGSQPKPEEEFQAEDRTLELEDIEGDTSEPATLEGRKAQRDADIKGILKEFKPKFEELKPGSEAERDEIIRFQHAKRERHLEEERRRDAA